MPGASYASKNNHSSRRSSQIKTSGDLEPEQNATATNYPCLHWDYSISFGRTVLSTVKAILHCPIVATGGEQTIVASVTTLQNQTGSSVHIRTTFIFSTDNY